METNKINEDIRERMGIIYTIINYLLSSSGSASVPLSGHGFHAARVSSQLGFYEVNDIRSPHAQSTTWTTQVFLSGASLNPSSTDWVQNVPRSGIFLNISRWYREKSYNFSICPLKSL
jgi:hypothetical protein